MPAKRRNVPEHLRRAIRLAISVGIAAATGFALLEPLGGTCREMLLVVGPCLTYLVKDGCCSQDGTQSGAPRP